MYMHVVLVYLLYLLGVAGELEVVPEDLSGAFSGLCVAPPLVPLDLIEEYLRVARLLYLILSFNGTQRHLLVIPLHICLLHN